MSATDASAARRWLVGAHRFVATGLIALAIALVGFAVFLGFFAWLNDGAAAGLGLILVVGGFAAASLAVAMCFRLVANAHAAGSPRRWWLQLLLPMAAWIAFGLAAEFSSVVEKLLR